MPDDPIGPGPNEPMPQQRIDSNLSDIENMVKSHNAEIVRQRIELAKRAERVKAVLRSRKKPIDPFSLKIYQDIKPGQGLISSPVSGMVGANKARFRPMFAAGTRARAGTEMQLVDILEANRGGGAYGMLRAYMENLGGGKVIEGKDFFDQFNIPTKRLTTRALGKGGKNIPGIVRGIRGAADKYFNQVLIEGMKGESLTLSKAGTVGAMKVDVFGSTMRQLLKDPSRYFGGTFPELQTSHMFGSKLGDIVLPHMFGNAMLGLPRSIVEQSLELSSEFMRPEFLGGGPGYLSTISSLGMRFPTSYASPRYVETEKGLRTQSVDQAVSSMLRAPGIRGHRQTAKAIRSTIASMSTVERTAYAGYFRGMQGELTYDAYKTAEGGVVSTNLAELIQSKRDQVFESKRDRASQIMMEQSEVAKLIQEETWRTGTFTEFSKAESLLNRGMVTQMPIGALLPFGSAANWGRQPYQATRPGMLIGDLVNQMEPSLPGGRHLERIIESKFEAEAEAMQRRMHGAPSGVMRNVGFLMPGTTTQIDGKTGKFTIDPLAKAIHTRIMGDVVISQRLNLELTSNIADLAALNTDDGISRTGKYLFDSFFKPGGKPERGMPLMFMGVKAQAAGVSKIFEELGALKDIDILASNFNLAGKYPHEYFKGYLGGLISKVGPKSGSEAYFKKQTAFLNKLTGIVNEDVSDVFGAMNPQVKAVLKTQGKTSWKWIPTKTGEMVAKMVTTGKEAFVGRTFTQIKAAISEYNKGLPKKHQLPETGVEMRTFESAPGVMSEMAVFPAWVMPRQENHRLQALLGMARNKGGGDPFATYKGAKISDLTLHNLTGSNVSTGAAMRDLLESVVAQQAKLSPTVLRDVEDIMEVMASAAGTERIAKTKVLGLPHPDELLINDMKEFRNFVGTLSPIPANAEGLAEYEGTILEKFWDKRVRLTLPETRQIKIGGQDIAIKQVVLPRLSMLAEKGLLHGEKVGDFYKSDVLRAYERVYSEAFESGLGSAQFTTAVGNAYDEFYKAVATKGGRLQEILQPRLRGSSFMSLIGAFDDQKMANKLGGGEKLNFSEIAINPKDFQLMGGRGKSSYGLFMAYPEQGVANALAVKFIMDKTLGRGQIASSNATARASFRDHDFDRSMVMVNPFDPKTKEWRNFNKVARNLNKTHIELFKDGASATEIAKATDKFMGEMRQFIDPEEFFTEREKQFKKSLDAMRRSSTDAKFAAAFNSMSEESPEFLYQWLARRGDDPITKRAAQLGISAQISTKLSTGRVSNIMVGLKKVSDAYSQSTGIQLLTDTKAMTELNEVATHSRKMHNFNTMLAHAEQGGSVAKGTASSAGLIGGLIEYSISRSKKSLRDEIGSIVEDVTMKDLANTLKEGTPFKHYMGAGVTPKEYIKFTTKELYDHVTGVLNYAKNQGVDPLSLDDLDAVIRTGKDFSSESRTYRVVKFIRSLLDDVPRNQMAARNREIISNLGYSLPSASFADVAMDNNLDQIQDVVEEVTDPKNQKEKSVSLGYLGDKARAMWQWFTRSPTTKDGDMFYAKRVGAAAAVGLVGVGILKSLLFTSVSPEEPRRSSYIQQPPLQSGLDPYVDMGYSVNEGNGMPAAYAPVFDSVGNAMHPLITGPAMKPHMGVQGATGPAGMPPSAPWTFHEPPSDMSRVNPSIAQRGAPMVNSEYSELFPTGRSDMGLSMMSTAQFTRGAGIIPISGINMDITEGYVYNAPRQMSADDTFSTIDRIPSAPSFVMG